MFWKQSNTCGGNEINDIPPKIHFAIPTGAGGHLTAGIISQLMGLNIGSLIVSTNDNDILSTMIEKGFLQKKGSVISTNSPAMDIQAPYNIERIFYLLSNGKNKDNVKAMMEKFNKGEKLMIPEDIMSNLSKMNIQSESITKENVLTTIKDIYESENYIIDPHSAVGMTAIKNIMKKKDSKINEGEICIGMGCAHPIKFGETIAEALNINENEAESMIFDKSLPLVQKTFTNLKKIEGKCLKFSLSTKDQWEQQLREKILAIRSQI